MPSSAICRLAPWASQNNVSHPSPWPGQCVIRWIVLFPITLVGWRTGGGVCHVCVSDAGPPRLARWIALFPIHYHPCWVAHRWRCLPCVRSDAGPPRLAHIAKDAMYAPPDGCEGSRRVRRENRNSQNEPGMCPGINSFTFGVSLHHRRLRGRMGSSFLDGKPSGGGE